MDFKNKLIDFYFFAPSFLCILFSFNLFDLKLNNLTLYYTFGVTVPFFILQIYSLTKFSKKVKEKNLKLYKKACIRPNGSKSNSINVASLFDESIPFSEIKDELLAREFRFTKKAVIYSMLSFIILIILYFI
ncbi:MAG: hypothetical protein CMD18_02585 [Flavobacteriales bacterium]|nr:hypothetical protein [Flavobacteriales bacterium]